MFLRSIGFQVCKNRILVGGIGYWCSKALLYFDKDRQEQKDSRLKISERYTADLPVRQLRRSVGC
jgi:hypothetical protein